MYCLIKTLTVRFRPATQTLRLVRLGFVARRCGWDYPSASQTLWCCNGEEYGYWLPLGPKLRQGSWGVWTKMPPVIVYMKVYNYNCCVLLICVVLVLKCLVSSGKLETRDTATVVLSGPSLWRAWPTQICWVRESLWETKEDRHFLHSIRPETNVTPDSGYGLYQWYVTAAPFLQVSQVLRSNRESGRRVSVTTTKKAQTGGHEQLRLGVVQCGKITAGKTLRAVGSR